MNNAPDIQALLKAWPYEPENDARIVKVSDGREVLQVRLPLGIEQYEMNGRPDGRRPHGHESALEYHLARLAEFKVMHEPGEFRLSHKDCAELISEGTLYYLRYLRLFQLRDWQRTVRDTSRNLRLFDFLHRFAERQDDREHLEQWRPYILRIQATASTMIELESGHHDRALSIVRAAVDEIENLAEMEADTFKFERDRSLVALRELARQIRAARPVSETERLEKELSRAVEQQEFERAAEIRDRLKALRSRPAQSETSWN